MYRKQIDAVESPHPPLSRERNVPRSVAAAAQLLELWVHGYAVLDKPAVDQCLQLLSVLDSDVADKYHSLYVD